jgi:transposase
MVSIYMFQKIRELNQKGFNKSQIAKELKIDRKTVSTYLESNAPPQYKSRSAPTRVDLFLDFESRAKQLLSTIPDVTAREIYEWIKDEGYLGSERTVDRRISKFKIETTKSERFFEQTYEPAEQSQFDFKEKVELPFIDGRREVQLHFGTLPFSDTCRIRAYPRLTYECFMDGIHYFFKNIGGITKNIRIDNLSPCVSKVLKGSKRKWTQSFDQAITYYGFGVLPCSPGKGNEKGDVERDIRTYAARIRKLVAMKGIIFKDWEDLNGWLSGYMEARQSEESKLKLKEENKELRPCPGHDENIVCRVHLMPASSYGTIHIRESNYSVPDQVIDQGVRVVVGPYDVRIYRTDNKECVSVHPVVSDGENSILLKHILPSLIRKPHAMVRWNHREILFPEPCFKLFYEKLKCLDELGAEREFLRTINLVHHTTLSEIAVAITLVLETGSINLFEDTRELLLGERRPLNVIDIALRMNQEKIKPKLSDYDNFIPKTK